LECDTFCGVGFGLNSELKRIESGAFIDTSLEMILLHQQISFISGTVFPEGCEISLEGYNADEFSAWDLQTILIGRLDDMAQANLVPVHDDEDDEWHFVRSSLSVLDDLFKCTTIAILSSCDNGVGARAFRGI
jgi:hypothetical protein